MAGTTRKGSRNTPKTRTVSSNDAKQHWGTMLKAVDAGEDVIVASYGKARAVVISADDYEEYQTLKEKQRRDEALALLRELEASYDGRNNDLTEAEIEEAAVREGREINRAAAERLRQRTSDPE